MTDQYVPALRQRFLEDMRIKGLQPKRQTMYLQAMQEFTRFLGHSPDTATPEELRAFQLDLKEKGVGAPTFNNRLTVLSFFFATTCPRPEMKRHMRYQRAAKKIPVVLSAEEVARILEAAPGPGLRYRAAFGARIGMTSVLHTWGSAMTHHPHVHVIVPGGGVSPDGTKWIGCRPGFFLPAKVLSRLFRRLFLEGLVRLHKAGKLRFFGDLSNLADPAVFAAYLAPLRKTEWVVYAKPPFGGPEAVLAYLSRYTHRVAVSNHRLVSADTDTVAFRWKDYHIKRGDRMKVMRLPTDEFIRRFLIHVLPSGFHRICHAGFLANGIRRDRIERIRRFWDQTREPDPMADEDHHADTGEDDQPQTCPKCGGAMRVIEIFTRGQTPKSRAPPWQEAA